MTQQDARYVYCLAVGSLALAEQLTRLEKDPGRKERKRRAVAKKTELLFDTYPAESDMLHAAQDGDPLLEGLDDIDARRTLLVDLMFSNPFAPYELKFEKSEMDSALKSIAEALALSPGDVAAIRKTQSDALKAHVKVSAARAAAMGVGAAAVLATGAWLAAPAIAGAIGAAVGLHGVAATNFGLALLGGGSLAAGGYGMAGGMLVVTGIGAVSGFGSASGAMVMMELGSARSKAELIKLQVTYKEVLLRNQADAAKAQSVVTNLGRQLDDLRDQLDVERQLNDKNAERLKNLERTIEAVEDSLKWMNTQSLN
jgi:hypothetical protein